MAKQATATTGEASAEALIAEGLQTPAKAAAPPASPGAAGTAAAGAAEKPPAGEGGTPVDGSHASGTGQYVSREDVKKLVADRVAAELNKAQDTRIKGDTREQFLRDNLGDLPLSVQNLMPNTGDIKALAVAEQDIRNEMTAWFQAGLKRLGLRMPPVDGGAGTASLGPMAFGNEISPTDLIRAGLSRNRGQSRVGE